MSNTQQIHEFLGQKRLAIVGVSKRPNDFSRTLFRAFRQRGYDVVAVNPGAAEIEGRPCFPTVRDVEPPVDTVLLMTSPGVTDSVVRDCAEAGVARVWMYRAGGAGAVSPQAVRFCEAKGIKVIAGECPFMFFPGSGLPHQIHGWWRRLRGKYPH